MERDFRVAAFMVFIMVFTGMLQAQVIPGADRTELYYPLLKGKSIGVVVNQASVSGGANIVDVLVGHGLNVARIFSPEHGFRVSAEAGQDVGNSIDSVTGIPVVSLFGSKKKPTPGDLKSLDLILFDIQDVGVRFYTYISTLSYVMEACAENEVPLIVLDRPNPNGFYVDGPVLEKQFCSFVGMHPVPVVYGMTIGEYACMVNGEGWMKNGVKCDLRVIPLENYNHSARTGIPVKPSPNLINLNAILLYPSLCFFEGTSLSIGRGTPFPFEVYGHPDLGYGNFYFTPESIRGVSLHPPMEGRNCRGEDLRDFYTIHSGESGKIYLGWIIRAYQDWRDKSAFFTGYFDKLAGNSLLRQQIIQGKSEKEIRESWDAGIKKFKRIRGKYLMY